MLINLSNHPSTRWGEKQMSTALEQYGNVHDIPFPNIPPAASTEEVSAMAAEYVRQIEALQASHPTALFAVHIMGEMTFIHRAVSLLQEKEVTCLASTTERNTVEHPDGSKTFKFDFIQFREYN